MHWRVNASWFQQGMMMEAAPGAGLRVMRQTPRRVRPWCMSLRNRDGFSAAIPDS